MDNCEYIIKETTQLRSCLLCKLYEYGDVYVIVAYIQGMQRRQLLCYRRRFIDFFVEALETATRRTAIAYSYFKKYIKMPLGHV